MAKKNSLNRSYYLGGNTPKIISRVYHLKNKPDVRFMIDNYDDGRIVIWESHPDLEWEMETIGNF